MDRSRIVAERPDMELVADLEHLQDAAAGADLVVVDLGRPGVLDALPVLVTGAGTVVGFASHVESALLEQAVATGCRALPRSRFFGRLSEHLAGT